MKIRITPEDSGCTAQSFFSASGRLNVLINVEKRFELLSTESSSDGHVGYVFIDNEQEIRVELQPQTLQEKKELSRPWFLCECKGEFHFLYPPMSDVLMPRPER